MGQIICMGQQFAGGDMTSVSGWSSTSNYIENDIVRYNSVTYRCVQNCIGQVPSSTSSYWKASSVGDAVNLINHRPGGGADIATPTSVGTVMPDNVTITVNANGVISSLPSLSMKVVAQLPTTEISTTTIYLVPKEQSQQGDIYTEYIYVNNAWEQIGSTAVDLSDYLQKTGDGSSVTSAIASKSVDTVTSISSSTLSDMLGQINANLEILKKVEKAAGSWVEGVTIPSGSVQYIIEDPSFNEESVTNIYYSPSSIEYVSGCTLSAQLATGSLKLEFSEATSQDIVMQHIHVVNP